MELKLYQHIRRYFLKKTIDLFDKSTTLLDIFAEIDFQTFKNFG